MSQGKILLVDDDVGVRLAVGLALTKAGYEVAEAGDGEEAIRLIEKDQNGSNVVTIICDLQMPGLGGSRTMEYFQTHHPSIPLIILTGAPDAVLTEVLQKRGMIEYLCKPVSTNKLLETVRRAAHLCAVRKSQG
jgi:DNA-binding NtrC family response regulator